MSTKRRTRHDAAIISAHGIVNRFGTQEVHDHLDLEVMRGEILGIVGASGSGKSVLLKTLTGLHRPNHGNVLINGTRVESISAADKAASIGVLFQHGALFSSLTVTENVMLPLREYTDLPRDEREKIAAMKLKLAGFPSDGAMKLPRELSGGMVKRAAFARAVALDPEILFLDEPTSGLDPLTAGRLEDLIRHLNDSLGMTIVIATHDLVTLFTLCDRVGVLVDKKIRIDTVEKLMHSSEPWIHQFLHGLRARGAMSIRNEADGTRR
jgi:phospholipid/cholesterol/gamma-HCH transport system ATP-binding protein